VKGRWGYAAAFVLALATAPALLARPVGKPLTKGLPHGAVFQPKPSARHCFGSNGAVRLGRVRCTTIAQLRHVDTTQPPHFARDSRVVYLAAQGGVLLLKRDSAGGLSYLDCFQISGPCTAFTGDGTSVLEMAVTADGKHLYVLLNRAQDEGTELHALAIGPDDRLTADPSCLLLIRDPGYPVDNARGCRTELADYHVGGYGLTLTPDARHAFLVELSDSSTNLVIDSLAADANGSLSLLPGCVSATGKRPPAGTCETLLANPPSGGDLFNILGLVVTPDSGDLIVQGDEHTVERGNFLVRLRIGADGSLTRTACLTRVAAHGCTGTPLLLGNTSLPLPLRDGLYVGSSGLPNPSDTSVLSSDLLSFRLPPSGGFSLTGCTGHLASQTRIRKLAGCALGREPLRQPQRLLAAPDGNTLLEVGAISGALRGFGLFKVGGGVARSVTGAGGCLIEAYWLPERARCNRVFTPGVLDDAELTSAVSPDGTNVYVVSQQRDQTVVHALDRAQ
jgi:hypothetical protein